MLFAAILDMDSRTPKTFKIKYFCRSEIKNL